MASYDFKSLGYYKDLLFQLLTFSGEKSDLLIEIVMPVLDDSRFNKFDNFIGGEYECYDGDDVEYVKLNGHLYDVPFVYTTITDTINAICIDTNLNRCNQNTKDISIVINVMCHKDNLTLDVDTKRKFKKLGYTGNRLDIIVALVGEILNYASDVGIGSLTPSIHNPVVPYYPNQNFFGKTLSYSCSDFMVDYSQRSINGD